jgi:predicted O-methyltransferase YrrM
MRVFEYGAGGSTIFLASRAGQVVSVEHDEQWAREVERAAAALELTNSAVLHVAPSRIAESITGGPDDPNAYVSSNPEFGGKSFRAYAAAIEEHADAGFHMVLLDGRARPSCFKHALPKVAPGGIMMLDNAERARYAYIGHTLDALGWRRHDFAGAGPYNLHFWKTSAWERPGR